MIKITLCLILFVINTIEATLLADLEPRRIIFRHYHGGFGGFMAMLTETGDIEFYEEVESDKFVPSRQVILPAELEALKEMIAAERIIPQPISDHETLLNDSHLKSFSVIRNVDGKAVSLDDMPEEAAFQHPVFGPKLVAIRRRFLLKGLEKWATEDYVIVYHMLSFDLENKTEPEGFVLIRDIKRGRDFTASRLLLRSNEYQEYVAKDVALGELYDREIALGNIELEKVGNHKIIFSGSKAVLGPLSYRAISPDEAATDAEVGIFVKLDFRLNCLEQFGDAVDPENDELIVHLMQGKAVNVALIRNRTNGRFHWLSEKKNESIKRKSFGPLTNLIRWFSRSRPGPQPRRNKVWERLDRLPQSIISVEKQDELIRGLNQDIENNIIVPLPLSEYHPVVEYKESRDQFVVHSVEKKLPDIYESPGFHPVINAIYGAR